MPLPSGANPADAPGFCCSFARALVSGSADSRRPVVSGMKPGGDGVVFERFRRACNIARYTRRQMMIAPAMMPPAIPPIWSLVKPPLDVGVGASGNGTSVYVGQGSSVGTVPMSLNAIGVAVALAPTPPNAAPEACCMSHCQRIAGVGEVQSRTGGTVVI